MGAPPTRTATRLTSLSPRECLRLTLPKGNKHALQHLYVV